MQTVNQRLKIIRDELGLNQSEFADSLEIKQSYLSALEKGKKEVTFKLCTRLSEKHGISIDWLITGKGQIRASLTTNFIDVNNEVKSKGLIAFEDLETLLFNLLNKSSYKLVKL